MPASDLSFGLQGVSRHVCSAAGDLVFHLAGLPTMGERPARAENNSGGAGVKRGSVAICRAILEQTIMESTEEKTNDRMDIPVSVLNALWQIIDRYSDDERRDYESRSESDRDGHVYQALNTVGHWLSVSAGRRSKPQNTEASSDSFWGPVISKYTRAQAIEDRVLIDVTKMAHEAGFKYPTAVTSAVWAKYVTVPEGVEAQDEQGRLWDILFMLHMAIKGTGSPRENPILFQLLVRNDNFSPVLVTLKAIFGPGDTLEPVITILLPNED